MHRNGPGVKELLLKYNYFSVVIVGEGWGITGCWGSLLKARFAVEFNVSTTVVKKPKQTRTFSRRHKLLSTGL